MLSLASRLPEMTGMRVLNLASFPIVLIPPAIPNLHNIEELYLPLYPSLEWLATIDKSKIKCFWPALRDKQLISDFLCIPFISLVSLSFEIGLFADSKEQIMHNLPVLRHIFFFSWAANLWRTNADVFEYVASFPSVQLIQLDRSWPGNLGGRTSSRALLSKLRLDTSEQEGRRVCMWWMALAFEDPQIQLLQDCLCVPSTRNWISHHAYEAATYLASDLARKSKKSIAALFEHFLVLLAPYEGVIPTSFQYSFLNALHHADTVQIDASVFAIALSADAVPRWIPFLRRSADANLDLASLIFEHGATEIPSIAALLASERQCSEAGVDLNSLLPCFSLTVTARRKGWEDRKLVRSDEIYLLEAVSANHALLKAVLNSNSAAIDCGIIRSPTESFPFSCYLVSYLLHRQSVLLPKPSKATPKDQRMCFQLLDMHKRIKPLRRELLLPRRFVEKFAASLILSSAPQFYVDLLDAFYSKLPTKWTPLTDPKRSE